MQRNYTNKMQKEKSLRNKRKHARGKTYSHTWPRAKALKSLSKQEKMDRMEGSIKQWTSHLEKERE
ncbi:unnamed protein product, partial [Rangifer tarandus platyrhynchus]